jgi:hypothetical protein
LSAGRAREELTQRDEICVCRVIDPPPTNYDFLTVIADMRDRATKRGQSEFEEGKKYLERGTLTHT